MGGPPEGGNYDSLLLAATPFISSQRRATDVGWKYALGLLYTGCLLFSLHAWNHSNPDFLKLTPEFLEDPANCPLHPDGRHLLGGDGAPKFDAANFLQHASTWIAVSVVASLGVAAAFLHLVRHHTATLARTTIGFQLAVPTIGALALLLSGAYLQALFLGALAALTYWVFFMWRREISSATKLLSVAGHGLAANAVLIGFTVALNLASLLLALPQLVAMAVAFSNGDVVPNPARDNRDACVDHFGDGVPCCAWQLRTHIPIYLGLAGWAAAWTMFTAQQVRVFAVSGTIAQWYFAPHGTTTAGNAARSLGHALGPQLGTNAFAGLVLTITNAIHQQSAADQQSGNASFLGILSSWLASLYEYLTKFATVMSAITGDALLPAGRKVTDLLLRNFLEAFATTVWFPSVVVGLASITLSVLWGAAVWAAYRWTHGGSSGELYPASDAAVLGALAGVTTLFVLSFLAGMLLSVLDAVFVCFALDRDRQAVSNAELYEALLDVAESRGVGGGVAVEQPAGGMAYGASVYSPPEVQRSSA